MPAKTVASKGKVTPAVATDLLTAYQAVLDEQAKAFEAQLQEKAAEWEKELARKKEQDVYDFNVEKRNREDTFKAQLASRETTVAEREAKVKEREVLVGDAEKVIAGLQKSVEGIPAVAATAEASGYKKGVAEAQKEAEANARIKDAETTAAVGIKDNQIETLNKRVAELEGQLSTLRIDLQNANQRVQEIANSAVNASAANKVTIQNTPATTGR
jgi:uncharacterized coiled-coil protein SlyX